MTRLDRALLASLIVPFFVADFFQYGGTVKDFGRAFLAQETAADQPAGSLFHGDLYYFSDVERFKERIIESDPPSRGDIADADLILQGDSFAHLAHDTPALADFIAQVTGRRVFFRQLIAANVTPADYVSNGGLRALDGGAAAAPERVLLWEVIERRSLSRLGLVDPSGRLTKRYMEEGSAAEPAAGLLHRHDVEFFVRNNRYAKPLNAWLKNAAFDWFGDLDSRTPVARANPDMLFLEEEVTFRKDQTKLADIPAAADGVARHAAVLRAKYGLRLVVLVIPDKLTLYGDGVAGIPPYDGYLPKLEAALRERGVGVVSAYTLYRGAMRRDPRTAIYYGGDTHYNAAGKTLLVEALAKAPLFSPVDRAANPR